MRVVKFILPDCSIVYGIEKGWMFKAYYSFSGEGFYTFVWGSIFGFKFSSFPLILFTRTDVDEVKEVYRALMEAQEKLVITPLNKLEKEL